MNKDNIKGKLKDLGGKAEATICKATGDADAEAEGRGKQVEGKVQNAWGNVKKEVRDARDDIEDSLNKDRDRRDEGAA